MARSRRAAPRQGKRSAFDQTQQAQRPVRGTIYDQAQERSDGRSAGYGTAGAGRRGFYDQQAGRTRTETFEPDILTDVRRASAADEHLRQSGAAGGGVRRTATGAFAAQPSQNAAAAGRKTSGKKAAKKAVRRKRPPAQRPAESARPETVYDTADDDAPMPVKMRERGQAAKVRARRRRAVALSVLVVLAVGIWALIAFAFKIGEIRVSGSSVYNETVILEQFGYRIGDNLFSFNKKKAAQEIAAALPYLETVSVTRTLPATVHIQVTASEEKYCFVRRDGSTVITTPSLKVLRLGSNPGSLLEISGAAIGTPVPGQPLELGEPEALQSIMLVLEALENGGIRRYSELNISDPYSITVKCEDRFLLKLGTTVDLDYKLELAAEMIYNRLAEDATGVIDAGSAATSRSAYYTPQLIN